MILHPGATIGVMGDGQLGRMLALEARRIGYKTLILGTNPSGSAGQVADGFVQTASGDWSAAAEFGRRCDVVTVETEHIPAEALAAVESVTTVRPGAHVLSELQDRLRQRRFLANIGVPQTAFAPVGTDAEAAAASAEFRFPAVLKARTSGYDGKGQVWVARARELSAARQSLGGRAAVLEAKVPFAREISVLLARAPDGRCAFFPIVENEHRAGILHLSRVPARLGEQSARQALDLATTIANKIGHVGVLAVEMFVLQDGALLVNEIAPRVHNSGHFTLGACTTSQFEQHIRAICGLALGNPELLRPVAMVNLLGDLWLDRPGFLSDLAGEPDARLHLYGKHPPARGRKMGHFLVLGASADEAATRADAIAEACIKSAGAEGE